MSAVTKNEEVLSSYITQWESLETELKSSDLDEKTKTVALHRFQQMKQNIYKDATLLKDVISYSTFVGVLAGSTERLASLILRAKVSDHMFKDRQEKLMQNQAPKEERQSFISEDFLNAIAEDGLGV